MSLDTQTLTRVYILGAFRIERGNQPLRLYGRKDESLFAFLVLHPESHAREKLAALCWGDVSDEQARGSLRKALTHVRAVLGTDIFLADRQAVQLNPAYALWCDARELEHVTHTREWTTVERMNETRRQLDELDRGDLLRDFYDEWIFPRREKLRADYLETLLALTQAYRAQSEYACAIETAQQVLRMDTANERAHQHLMFCYVANGDRHTALHQYEECVRALQTELGVEPSRETQALYAWLKQVPGERVASEALITNLPIPLSSFVGREHETTEIQEILKAGARLLTLTGPGGSGKTRLAIRTTTELVCTDGGNDTAERRFGDGVWWVELAALVDATNVLGQIAKTVGARETPDAPLLDTLKDLLHSKRLLLILDNCEHVLIETARLARVLLTHCAQLQILATSREPLRIAGERVYPVPTMRVPPRRAWTYVDLLREFEGIRLFVERAHAVEPRFELTETNASAVAQICARLDGIPLALELAASRIRMFSPQEVAARLDARFELLQDADRAAPPRHQTLRAVLDWSSDLLTESERVLFRRMAVFAGGASFAALQAVTRENATDSILDTLTHLIDKSLVVATSVGTATRYSMLETIHEYAREMLIASGEETEIRARHLAFFCETAQTMEPSLFEAGDSSGIRWAETELDNLRAGLTFVLDPLASELERESRAEIGLEMMLHVWRLWLYNNTSEGDHWLNQLLAAQPKPTLARTRALFLAGDYARYRGDYATEKALIDESVVSAQQLGEPMRIAWSIYEKGLVETDFLRFANAIRYFRKATELFRKIDTFWMYRSIFGLAELLAANGELEQAKRLWMEGLEWFRSQENPFHVAWALEGLGTIARLEGNFENARILYSESIKLRQQVPDKVFVAESLEVLGQLAAAQSQFERAAVLWGAAHYWRNHFNTLIHPIRQFLYTSLIPLAREQLGAERFASAWARGAALSLDAAVELALNPHQTLPDASEHSR